MTGSDNRIVKIWTDSSRKGYERIICQVCQINAFVLTPGVVFGQNRNHVFGDERFNHEISTM